MKKYRVWMKDAFNPDGFWWYCYLDNYACLQDYNYTNDEPNTLQWYIENEYKIEEL